MNICEPIHVCSARNHQFMQLHLQNENHKYIMWSVYRVTQIHLFVSYQQLHTLLTDDSCTSCWAVKKGHFLQCQLHAMNYVSWKLRWWRSINSQFMMHLNLSVGFWIGLIKDFCSAMLCSYVFLCLCTQAPPKKNGRSLSTRLLFFNTAWGLQYSTYHCRMHDKSAFVRGPVMYYLLQNTLQVAWCAQSGWKIC